MSIPITIHTQDPIRYDDREGHGMRFETRVKVIADGGRVKAADTGVRVESANSVTLLLAAATGFRGFDETSRPFGAGRSPPHARSRFTLLLPRHIRGCATATLRTIGSSSAAFPLISAGTTPSRLQPMNGSRRLQQERTIRNWRRSISTSAVIC